MAGRDVADVLGKARELLDTASLGVDMTSGDPRNRRVGLQNVATFGRSVTFVLQNLRSVVDTEAFDEWYQPQVALMKANAVCVYFKDLRTEILKQGTPRSSQVATIDFMTPERQARMMANPPPGAKSFFIGDNVGGNGWLVDMPDGTESKFYVDLPDDLGITVTWHLPNHPMPDIPIDELCRQYVEILTAIMVSAEHHFGSKPS